MCVSALPSPPAAIVGLLRQAGCVGRPADDVVLDLVEQVPPGRATTYGDLARMASDVGPVRVTARMAGQVLARGTREVPWWRVVAFDGRLPPGLEDEAAALLAAEGCPMRSGRVDLRQARWPDGGSSR